MTRNAIELSLGPLLVGDPVTLPTGDATALEAITPKPDGAAIASDGFSGTDGTTLFGRTPDGADPGNNWVDVGGWEIQGNTAQCVDDTIDGAAYLDVGAVDAVVDVDVTFGFGEAGGQHTGVVCRAVDTVTFLVFKPAGWVGTKNWELVTADGTVLARFANTSAAATGSKTVRTVAVGDRLTFAVDGVTVAGYSLTEAESAVYGAGQGFGMYSGERAAAPVGAFDNFAAYAVADPDASYLETSGPARLRFAIPAPSKRSGQVTEFVQVSARQSITADGYWVARVGSLDASGSARYAALLGAPAVTAGAGWVDHVWTEQGRLLDGDTFDVHPETRWFVELEAVTTNPDSTSFGVAALADVTVRVRRNTRPAVTIDTVTNQFNPAVTWVYDDPDGDDQTAYEVRIWKTADVPDKADYDTLSPIAVRSRIVDSSTARAHRVNVLLEAATGYTIGVRVWQDEINGRVLQSLWSVAEFTTGAATSTTPTITVQVV